MKPQSKSFLVRVFTFGSILGLGISLIHLYSGLTAEFTTIIIGDMAINMIFGLCSLLSAWFLKQGKQAAIYVVIIWILSGIVFTFFVGRGVNFFIIIAGVYFLWQLYALKKQGELV